MSMETIIVLGGSFAGISAAHYALRHTLPQLPKKEGATYTVTLVNPSKDFYWRIAGPRAIVSKEMMPPNKLFYPIEPAFAYAKGKFEFVQGTATGVDAEAKKVNVTTASGEMSIPYIALIIATGVSTPSPLFTQTTTADDLTNQHSTFQKSLADAKTVVIGGGGPVGVEVAGEVAEYLNGKPGWMASEPKNPPGKVTLVCADSKMLPVLRVAISKTAEKYLKKLGCAVLYNTKIISTNTTSVGDEGVNAKTNVVLSNGNTIEADIYIDATGIRPNTSFLPQTWLDARQRVSCDAKTLRVTSAGPMVYVVGDVGTYTRGGVMDQNDAIPVALTNLRTDLTAHLSGNEKGSDRHYKPNTAEQQICSIGTSMGVGAFGGYRIPSRMVGAIKGRDYMVGQLALGTLNGDMFKKEGKWKPKVVSGKAGLSSW